MNAELNRRLLAIVGNEFNYRGKNVKITGFKPVGATNVVVFMDERPHNFLRNEVEGFLNDLDSAKESFSPRVVVKKDELMVFEPTKENATVKETLLETLKKVKEDKDYIPQAQAVCDVVNQIVNVQKAEIQMFNLLNKRR